MKTGCSRATATCLRPRLPSATSNRVVTQNQNALGENHTPRTLVRPAGNWSGSGSVRTLGSLAAGHRLCGVVDPVASSRRRGQQRDHDHMRTPTTRPRNSPPGATVTGQFDAFDTAISQVSNRKTPYAKGELTRLTDLTVSERGGTYRSPARPRPPAHVLTHPPLSTTVKSVKSVKSQDGKGVFCSVFTPRVSNPSNRSVFSGVSW